MRFDKVNRRVFLQGVGGLLVSIPVLPSLAEKAFAAGPDLSVCNKRFFTISNRNQFPGYWLYPFAENTLTQATGYKYRDISTITDLCPMLGAGFQPYASKMALLRGLNMGFVGHTSTGILGNIAGTVYGGDGTFSGMTIEKTIDVFMAQHRGKSAGDILRMGIGTQNSMTSDGSASMFFQTGMPFTNNGNPYLIYQNKFVVAPPPPAGVLAGKKKLVDLILGDLRDNLRNKSFLSNADKVQLSNHFDFVSDLQGRYAGTAPPPPSCVPYTGSLRNSNGNSIGESETEVTLQQYTEDCATILSEAIKCNVATIGNIAAGVGANGTTVAAIGGGANVWHLEYAHGNMKTELTNINQWVLQNLFLKMIQQLDVEESGGKTFLDNSIISFVTELSEEHFGHDHSIIIAGSGNGTVNTGRYYDFRDYNHTKAQSIISDYTGAYPAYKLGMPYKRYWNGILQSWGLLPADYEVPGRKGFGHHDYMTTFNNYGTWFQPVISANAATYFADVGKPLPGVFNIPV